MCQYNNCRVRFGTLQQRHQVLCWRWRLMPEYLHRVLLVCSLDRINIRLKYQLFYDYIAMKYNDVQNLLYVRTGNSWTPAKFFKADGRRSTITPSSKVTSEFGTRNPPPKIHPRRFPTNKKDFFRVCSYFKIPSADHEYSSQLCVANACRWPFPPSQILPLSVLVWP